MVGTRVLKGHLKQKDAVKKLVKRAVDTVRSRHLPKVEDEVSTCPAELVNIVQEKILSKLNQVKSNIEREIPVLIPAVQRLSDENLNSLKEIFDARGSTEDKIYSSSFVFAETELSFIDQSIGYFNNLKGEVIKTYLTAYATEHSTVKGSSLAFDNESFLKILRDNQSYRRGILRSNQSSGNAEVELSESNSCVLM